MTEPKKKSGSRVNCLGEVIPKGKKSWSSNRPPKRLENKRAAGPGVGEGEGMRRREGIL